jgi:hypothetical protein
MNDEIVQRLTAHKEWLGRLIEHHQKHREALRGGPVIGDSAMNNLAIENLQGSYALTNKLLQEALGEVTPEKD